MAPKSPEKEPTENIEDREGEKEVESVGGAIEDREGMVAKSAAETEEKKMKDEAEERARKEEEELEQARKEAKES